MKTDQSTKAVVSGPVQKIEEEITPKLLVNKLLELEKKIEAIEKKLTTPLTN